MNRYGCFDTFALLFSEWIPDREIVRKIYKQEKPP